MEANLVKVIFILMQAVANTNSRSEFNVNQREQLGNIRLVWIIHLVDNEY